MIVVERAPPYLTVQDMGRPGYRASGVPHCGAMDQWSCAMANVIVANRRQAAALEWAIGGGSLRFEVDAMLALTGADADISIDDSPVDMNRPLAVRAGQILTVQRIMARRFLYVAVRGGVDCPVVLGSRSTYLPASFGGIEGRRLARGDVLQIGDMIDSGASDPRSKVMAVAPDYDARAVRVIPRASGSFLNASYMVSQVSDRMGYRLEADRELTPAGASITSEPVSAGVIQLPPGGQPIVLMADSPTIGGYCVLGTVISCDLPIVAQCLPGRKLRFEKVGVDDAQELLRARERALSRSSQDRPPLW